MYKFLFILGIVCSNLTVFAEENNNKASSSEHSALYFYALKKASPTIYETNKIQYFDESIKKDFYAIAFLREDFSKEDLKPLAKLLSFEKSNIGLIHNLNKIILFSVLLRNHILSKKEINDFLQSIEKRLHLRYFAKQIFQDKVILNEGEFPDEFKLIINEYPEEIPQICFYYPASKLAVDYLSQSSKSFDEGFLNKLAFIHPDSVNYFIKYKGVMQAIKDLPDSWIKFKIYKKFYPNIKYTDKLIAVIQKQFEEESHNLSFEMSLFLVYEKEHKFCDEIIKFISSDSKLKALKIPLSGKGLDDFKPQYIFKKLYKRNQFNLVSSTLYGLYGENFLEKVKLNFDKNLLSYGIKSKDGDLEEQITDFEVMNLQNFLAHTVQKYIDEVKLQLDYSRDIQDLKEAQ